MKQTFKTVADIISEIKMYVDQKVHMKPLNIKVDDDLEFDVMFDDETDTLMIGGFFGNVLYPIWFKVNINDINAFTLLEKFIAGKLPKVNRFFRILNWIKNLVKW